MAYVGSFHAQERRFFNTYRFFQVIVFPDRLFLLRSGGFLNMRKQIATRGRVQGPIGLADHLQGAQTPEEIRRLGQELTTTKSLQFGKREDNFHEIAVEDITLCRLTRGFLAPRILFLQARGHKPMSFRLHKPDSNAAEGMLRPALGAKLETT
jgi:hypothetical protein